jgi:hypothetical protein
MDTRQNLQNLQTSGLNFFCRGPGSVVTSFFFGVGENLGNYFALRIEFSGSFKGIDGLGPLVADGIEAAKGEPQAPVVGPPFNFPLYQDNSKAGREVLAAFSEFVPPAGQITPPHPCPVKSLFHGVRPRRNLTGRALSPQRVERDVGKLAALVSQGKICIFQQSPVSTAIIQPFLVVRHHQMENMGELTD